MSRFLNDADILLSFQQRYQWAGSVLFDVARQLGAGTIGQPHTPVFDASTLALIVQRMWGGGVRNYSGSIV